MNTSFDQYLQEHIFGDSLEFDDLEPYSTYRQAIIDARKENGITQVELAHRTGMAQGAISKLENGYANPSIKTLHRLAKGMGLQLKIEFIKEGEQDKEQS